MKTRLGGADVEVKMKDMNEDDRKKWIYSCLEKCKREFVQRTKRHVGGRRSATTFEKESGHSSHIDMQVDSTRGVCLPLMIPLEWNKHRRPHCRRGAAADGFIVAFSRRVAMQTGVDEPLQSMWFFCRLWRVALVRHLLSHHLKLLLALQMTAQRETTRPSSR